MPPGQIPEDPRPHDNPWLVFAVVAAVMLGTLVVISRVVAAESTLPRFISASPFSQTEDHHFGGHSGLIESGDPRVASDLALPPSPGLREAASQAPAISEPPPLPSPAPPGVEDQEADASVPAVEAAVASPPPPAPIVHAPPPPLGATAAVVMERACGAVVWGLNERQRLAPASLTKIVTALVVADRADLDAVVTASVSASYMARTTGSSTMGLEPGMRVTVHDLLYGLMLPSGNDAALQIAFQLAGGVPGFAELMNLKAQQLGMRDSHFTNPHGLDDPGLFSTALDMALAGRAYLDNALLAQVAAAPSWRTMSGLGIKNGNRLLAQYPNAYGVKIGFTYAAKQTFVAAAERDGRHLIISLLGTSDRYGEAARLLDWAFANTEPACR